MRSRTVDLGGPVHFADFGGSGPTMVLVHGLGGSHLNWLAVGPALAARARVLAPDLAGFGRTPLAGRSAHVRANAQLLDRFIDAVAEGPATLIGNSMVGVHAMIGRIAAPALLVQGTRDRLVSLAASRATAALRPDWTLAVLEGIGHVPQLEAPERFVATVTGWLDGNVGRAGDGVSRAAR